MNSDCADTPGKAAGRSRRSTRATCTPAAVPEPTAPQADPLPAPATAPCPKCGHPMVLRTARTGPLSGRQFWGCSTFPRCKGTLKVQVDY